MQLPGGLAAVSGAVLIAAILGCRAWDLRMLGQGTEEFILWQSVGAVIRGDGAY